MLFSTAQEVREGRVADEEVDLKKHKENMKKKRTITRVYRQSSNNNTLSKKSFNTYTPNRVNTTRTEMENREEMK